MTSGAKQLSLPGFLASGAERLLSDSNPWWRGERLFGLPPHRRWAFAPTLEGLRRGLAPITVLRGPRQVGKTTLLNQVIDTLLNEGVQPHRIFRIRFAHRVDPAVHVADDALKRRTTRLANA